MAARALLALTMLGLALAAVPLGEGGGPTYIDGTAAGVWTPEGSPYVLVGNATVPADLTLTIEAGVIVQANRGVRLAVFGGLRVQGTPEAPVRFLANQTADAGYWSGIHAVNARELVLAHAIVEDAEAALTVMGGSALITGSSLSGSFRGLHVQGGAATVTETAFAQNAQAGVYARSAVLTMRNGLLAGNKHGMDLGGAEALVENTTFLGPTFADLSLDSGSVVTLRASVGEGPIGFVDAMSRVDLEGILAVSVTDAYGTPLAGASVLVEDNPMNGTWNVRTETNHEGRVLGLVVRERTMMWSGAVDFNPFTVTASAGQAEQSVQVQVQGTVDVALAVPVDLTPPTPVAARFLASDEDVPIVLDASASTDNDPDLATRGTFLWSFPELGDTLSGIRATYGFDTPGLYQGVLVVRDAAGNEGVLTFAVQVRDVTPPQIVEILAPSRGGLGQNLVFEAGASDNDPASAATITWEFRLGATTILRTGSRVEVAFDQAGVWTVAVTATDRSGNEISRERTVRIVAPPPPNPWPWIGGGAALLAAALGLATERGKVGLLTLLLPLYTRIKDEEVLDQFTRGQIYGYIRVHPGDTYTDIKRNLRLNNGTLTYHLDVLEKQGLVRSMTRGARKVFYPIEIRPAEDGGGLHELQHRLLRVLGEAPGAAVGDIAAVLGVSRQLALYHLRLLSAKGLVRLERQGLKLRGFAVNREP